MQPQSDVKLKPGWWALIFLVAVFAFLFVTLGEFRGTFTSSIPAVLTSDRAGLVMEPGAKVKLRGVQVGEVTSIDEKPNSARLDLAIDPDQVKFIPANIEARIRASTIFGAKYVDLIYPADPSPTRLAAGAIIRSENVSTEVNTVFQNLAELLKQIDPGKLNSVLTAFAEGLRGQGAQLNESIKSANEVLLELNPRAEAFRRDWRSLKSFADTYGDATGNIMQTFDALAVTSTTVTAHADALDALLLDAAGLSRSGTALLGPSEDDLVRGVNDLEPTTALLLKYNPELTCALVGAQLVQTKYHWPDIQANNGYAATISSTFQFGSDPYRYPDNLPIIGAKGGPGGKPGCGSLPDVSLNWPVRQLITNTGWGTGLDWRPNPGIGFPGWADYFPVTRAVPQPPSIRYPGGPAPGPAPAVPGGAPYGAPWYAPDGTPLFPGVPPGVPSTSPPPDPAHLPPGAEPFSPPDDVAPSAAQPDDDQAPQPVGGGH